MAAWPAIALVGSYELLMMIIRSAQAQGAWTTIREARAAEDAGPGRGGSTLAVAILDQGREPGWVAAMIACSTSASWSVGLNWMSSVPASAAGACPGGM